MELLGAALDAVMAIHFDGLTSKGFSPLVAGASPEVAPAEQNALACRVIFKKTFPVGLLSSEPNPSLGGIQRPPRATLVSPCGEGVFVQAQSRGNPLVLQWLYGVRKQTLPCPKETLTIKLA